MKSYTITSSFVFLLFCIVLATSCKKDTPVGINEIRLTEARTIDSTGNVASINFQYDNEGRIKSYAYSYNHHTDKEATISYSGNMISIVYKPKTAFTISSTSSVWYILNDDQMPVQRIQFDSAYVADPTIGQISIWRDTAWYKYNAGLLTNITGIKYDSTWFRQNQDFITDKTNYSSNYTNTGNLLTQLSITASSTYRDMQQGKEQKMSGSGMEKYSFGYTQQYSNKIDFSNATLLAEFGVIFKRGLPLNRAYTNLPDKISFTDGTGRFYISDDLAFFPLNSVGYVENKTLTYDKNGFLSSVTNNNSSSNKTDFFYNN